MLTIHSIDEMRRVVAGYRRTGERVGFVPTMGDLHAGHLALVNEAARRARRVVASVFVNPTQFGPGEDFERYPRREREDAEKLAARGVDVLFLPRVEAMYVDAADTTVVTVPALRGVLCGVARPGHFDGVATVVCKLLNIIRPDFAVFGQKDFQQLVLIRQVTRDLALPVEIIGVETYREADGLAMSSRNRYLDERQRAIAPGLYRELKRAVAAAREAARGGGLDIENINTQTLQNLRAAGFEPEYVEIRRQSDLKPPRMFGNGGDDALPERALVMLAAVKIGQNRLIDNIPFELPA